MFRFSPVRSSFYRLLVVVLLLAGLLGCSSAEGPPSAPEDGARTVVLITVDTWRADRLGLYGGQAPTSPWLDELGRSSVVFDQAIAPAPWTWPTLVSIVTGLYPRSHGAVDVHRSLCAEAVTLPELFSEQGWRTSFIGINPYFEDDGGLGRGFSGLRQGFERWWAQGSGSDERVVQEAALILREAGAVSLFLHLHFFGPHSPFEPSKASRAAIAGGGDSWPPVRAWSQRAEIPFGVDNRCVARSDGRVSPEVREMQRAYDAELMDLDRRLGRIEELLRAANRWDKAWLVVTGDHGEEFCDHGMVGHGDNTHVETSRVPLVIRPPLTAATQPRRSGQPVSLVDVPVTLAQAVLGSGHASWDGVDLGPLLRGEPWVRPYPVVSETALLDGAMSIVGGEGRLVVDCCPPLPPPGGGLGAPYMRLYDLDDPAERTDRLASKQDPAGFEAARARATQLFQQLDAELRRQSGRKVCEGEVRILSEEQHELLHSLGYVTD